MVSITPNLSMKKAGLEGPATPTRKALIIASIMPETCAGITPSSWLRCAMNQGAVPGATSTDTIVNCGGHDSGMWMWLRKRTDGSDLGLQDDSLDNIE